MFQQFWLIGAFWVFSTILMLFPRNHFFNIAGRPVVLWLRFLVFETFCCVWQAGHAFCCVCRKFVVAELGFSRNTRCGYGSIPIDTFLVGWTSIYQLFWCSLGTRVLTHPHVSGSHQQNMGTGLVIGSIWFRLHWDVQCHPMFAVFGKASILWQKPERCGGPWSPRLLNTDKTKSKSRQIPAGRFWSG